MPVGNLKIKGAAGNVFNALGKIGLLIKVMDTYQANQFTNMTDIVNGIVGQFPLEADVQAIMGGSYIGALDAAGAVGRLGQSLAVAEVNRLVFRANAQLSQTLTNDDTLRAILELIRQMKVQTNGETVLNMPVTATAAAFVGKGNGVVVTSVNRPLDGLVLENSYAETITVTCTSDSYQTGLSAGNEGFNATGQGQETNPFAFNWPLGSGASTNLSAINGDVDNRQGNILTNSGFDSWTGKKVKIPGQLLDNWILDSGSIAQETGIVYSGTSALRINGACQLRQQFNSPTGTLGILQPQIQYSFNIFMRGAATGNLIFDLVDQNGTVIQDNNGVNNTFTVNAATLNNVYTAFNIAFRTPEVFPPTSYFIRIRSTISGVAYLDKGSLGAMTQVYRSGPFLAVHSGNIPFSEGGPQGDYSFVTVTNGRGAGGTLETFQTLFARLFADLVYNNEILLPSSPTPTISDTLIS